MMSFTFILVLNITEPTFSERPRVKNPIHLLFAYQATMVIWICFQEKKVIKSVCSSHISEYQNIGIHSGMVSWSIFSAQNSKKEDELDYNRTIKSASISSKIMGELHYKIQVTHC